MNAPKLFISYSWSSIEHEQWVINLATELRESGVDVILDKWDLKEGHDSVAFMEKMVTDPEIKKVAIICDEVYAAKADGRSGGVGTETQIISKEVYENQDQEKFVAVVCQKDAYDKPCLPTYYKSRIYIDLSEAERYSDNFERLLRWIFDKPLYVKPDIGKRPSFLSEGEHISLGTSTQFKRCIDAIKNHKPYAAGALADYFAEFAENLERFRISSSSADFDDSVIKSIEDFIPFRNEAIKVFLTISQYAPEDEFTQGVHKFFENLIPYLSRPSGNLQWSEIDADNFRFIVHELFIYALAIFLKNERIEQANYLLQKQYYLPKNAANGTDAMVWFTTIRQYTESLQNRNMRLGLRRLSIRADLLKERCAGTGVEFRHLLQADFVAFMRAEIEINDKYNSWWPETLLHSRHSYGPFEIFARSVSKSYFDKTKLLLSIKSPKDLDQLMQSYDNGSRRLPRWEMEGFNPKVLLGYEQLATRP